MAGFHCCWIPQGCFGDQSGRSHLVCFEGHFDLRNVLIHVILTVGCRGNGCRTCWVFSGDLQRNCWLTTRRPMLIAEEDLSPNEMIELEFSQYKTRESMLSKLDLGAARRAQQLGALLGSFLASQRKVDLSPGLRGKNSIFKGDAWKYSNGEEAHVESSLEMVMPKSLFLEKLEICESLACLREAHALRQKAEEGTTAFNFPHAILLGWQKSATTSLYQHLSDHPAVLASVEKEPEFFTLKCRGNPFFGCRSEDQKHYIREILQRDRYIGAGGRLMAFEASTHYAMNGDVLAAGMQKAMPWIKVVASLREPISRAASMLVHMYDKGAGCLAENRKRSLYYCLTTASQLTGHPGPYNMLDSPHGNYSTALEAWMKTFDSNNLHVIQYESLVDQESNSSSKSLHKLKTFLNLDPSLPDSHLRLHNSRKEQINPEGWPMKVKEYQDLIERVSPDVERCDFIYTACCKM